MAIVETLEVRFQANLGNLQDQISSIIGKLSALSEISEKTNARLGRALSLSRDAVLDMAGAVRTDLGLESKYQSELKNTARAARNAGKALRKAAEGIGLHRLDEVNLTQGEKSSGGGRGGKGGASGAAGDINEAREAALLLKKVTLATADSFKGLWQKAKPAISNIADSVNDLAGGIPEKLVKGFSGKAEKLGGMLREAVAYACSEGSATADAGAREIIAAIDNGLVSAAGQSTAPANAAGRLVGRLSEGITSRRGQVTQAAQSVSGAANFSSESAKTEANKAGASLTQGFADGISSKLSSVISSVSRVVSSAVSKIKNALRINSPSKVTYELGAFFGEGFSGGILSGLHAAQASASALSEGALSGLNPGGAALRLAQEDGGISGMVRGAVNEALGDTSLVIPLNVDGVKLGEASIRGINRVTRAAGRVLLEI